MQAGVVAGRGCRLRLQACAASTVSNVTKTWPQQWCGCAATCVVCFCARYSRCLAAATRADAFLRRVSGYELALAWYHSTCGE